MNYNHEHGELERSLGPAQARLLLTLAERFGRSFSMEQAQRIPELQSPTLKKSLHGLSSKGWLIGLGREAYMIAPLEAGPDSGSYALNGYLAAATIAGDRSYYLSYRTAMELHGMTLHPWRTVYVSTSSRLRSREIQHFSVKPVTIAADKIWGAASVEVVPDHRVNVSGLPRTLVDCLDVPRYAGGVGDVALGMSLLGDKLEPDAVVDAALRFGKVSVIKRLGVLLELVGRSDSEGLARLQAKVNETPHVFDPHSPRSGHLHPRWRIWMNVTEDELRQAFLS